MSCQTNYRHFLSNHRLGFLQHLIIPAQPPSPIYLKRLQAAVIGFTCFGVFIQQGCRLHVEHHRQCLRPNLAILRCHDYTRCNRFAALEGPAFTPKSATEMSTPDGR